MRSFKKFTQLKKLNYSVESFKYLDGGLNKHLFIDLMYVKKDELAFHMKCNEFHMGGSTTRTHGGAVAALGDTVVGFGAYLMKPKDASGFAVVDLNIKYLAPTTIGDKLKCVGKISHSGKTLQFWNAEITCGEKKVALISATCINLYKDQEKKETQKSSEKWGLNFDINKMSKEEIAERFDKYSPIWEDLVKFGKYQPTLKWVEEMTKNFGKKDGNVLDLACAVGLIGKTLRVNGITGKLYGIDISKKMVQKAMDSDDYNGVVQADLDEELPFSKKFDLITCIGAAELFSNVEVVLQNIAKVMHKNSEFWITFQYENGEINPTAHQGIESRSKDELEIMLNNAGMKIKSSMVIPQAYFTNNAQKPGEFVAVPYIALVCQLK